MSEKECRGFQWIGQSFDGCEQCGRHIREHEGLAWCKPGSSPFGGETVIIPFDEAAERIPLFGHYATPLNGSSYRPWHVAALLEGEECG